MSTRASLVDPPTTSGRSSAERRTQVCGKAFPSRKSNLEDGQTRRELVMSVGLGALSVLLDDRSIAWAEEPPAIAKSATIDYASPGPLSVIRLPRLKHINTSCSTSADRCTLKISAWVPQGGSSVGLKAPFPLVVITSGFLIGSDQYNSYAERLASWGYVVVSYDFAQQVLDPTTDIACVKMLEELIDWISTSGNPLSKVADADNVMLVGHSRGGKISTLAAINDKRVKSMFLLDPVDVTVYTPDDRINYPSATVALSAALSGSPARAPLPVCVVGAGRGGDCAPIESSYDLFYKAARGPAWKVVVEEAGHLQFLDQRGTTAMGAFCQAGTSMDDDVKDITRTVMVAWAETIMRRRDGSKIEVDASGVVGGVKAGDGRGGSDGYGRMEDSAVDAIDGVYASIRRSPVPAIFEYKNF